MHLLILASIFMINFSYSQELEPDSLIVCYGNDVTFEYSRTERCTARRGCGWDSKVKFSDWGQSISTSTTAVFVKREEHMIAFNIPLHAAQLISPMSGVISGKYYSADLVIYQGESVHEKYSLRCKHTGEIPSEWRY